MSAVARITWTPQQALAGLSEEIGRRLLKAAIIVQTELMARINISNPRPYQSPSKEGEWLRKRTGWAQAHVLYEPTSPAAAGKKRSVRVGYGKSAFYAALWGEVWRRRKGLRELMAEIEGKVRAALAG